MNYDIKQDKDKIRLELVPPSLMWAVGKIRRCGMLARCRAGTLQGGIAEASYGISWWRGGRSRKWVSPSMACSVQSGVLNRAGIDKWGQAMNFLTGLVIGILLGAAVYAMGRGGK